MIKCKKQFCRTEEWKLEIPNVMYSVKYRKLIFYIIPM